MLAARVSWCCFADSSSMGRLLLVLAHPVPPRPLLGLGSFVCLFFVFTGMCRERVPGLHLLLFVLTPWFLFLMEIAHLFFDFCMV